MHANRRRQCEVWSETSTPAYCYRFNVRSGDADYLQGSMHFEEVAFVFNNIAGQGYHYGKPFEGVPESYEKLSGMMTSMWAAFIHGLDPNFEQDDASSSAVTWEEYSAKDTPVDLLLDANVTSSMEEDTWRKDAIAYINSIPDVYER